MRKVIYLRIYLPLFAVLVFFQGCEKTQLNLEPISRLYTGTIESSIGHSTNSYSGKNISVELLIRNDFFFYNRQVSHTGMLNNCAILFGLNNLELLDDNFSLVLRLARELSTNSDSVAKMEFSSSRIISLVKDYEEIELFLSDLFASFESNQLSNDSIYYKYFDVEKFQGEETQNSLIELQKVIPNSVDNIDIMSFEKGIYKEDEMRRITVMLNEERNFIFNLEFRYINNRIKIYSITNSL